MKFCKNLQRIVEISNPEWAPYWPNYKMLKVSLPTPSWSSLLTFHGGSEEDFRCHCADYCRSLAIFSVRHEIPFESSLPVFLVVDHGKELPAESSACHCFRRISYPWLLSRNLSKNFRRWFLQISKREGRLPLFGRRVVPPASGLPDPGHPKSPCIVTQPPLPRVPRSSSTETRPRRRSSLPPRTPGWAARRPVTSE